MISVVEIELVGNRIKKQQNEAWLFYSAVILKSIGLFLKDKIY
jgi:hypothetical protein